VEKLTVSHWTLVEFSSLLAREVRMGGLKTQAARLADDQFADIIDESFVVLLPNAEDFNLAREFLKSHDTGLRAGDAFHLAIAKNHGAEAIYSLDKTMIKAGKSLGLPVTAGIRLPDYR
jgi:predicted nucleic acid-binding protein